MSHSGAGEAGAEAGEHYLLAKSDHWFDLLITRAGALEFARRSAGKMETGKPGRTDLGIGLVRLTV